MKKSLLALAVLGVFAGAASAQSTTPSTVTLYGIIDTGVRYTNPSGQNPVKNDTFDVYSGSQSGSRWGLRGSEDLGSGLRAVFTLESGFNVDTGTSAQGGRLFGRQAFAGLAGNWGEVRLGRQMAAGYEYFIDVDPFGAGFFDAGLQRTFSSVNALRLDNTIMYRSPTVSGFSGLVGYSFNPVASESPKLDNNPHTWTVGLRYGQGPFLGVLTYENVHNPLCYTGAEFSATGALNTGVAQAAGTDGKLSCPVGTIGGRAQEHYQAGATYDFKVVKLHAAYAYERHQFTLDTVTPSDKSQSYMGGLSVPVAGGNLFGMYQKRQDKSALHASLRAFSFGYTYPLSRRTNLEAYYADSKAQNDALVSTSCPTLGGENGSVGQFQCLSRRQVAFGLRHLF